MTLPASGPISCSQIDVELGDSGTSVISLGDADARALAGVPSGPISMSDFYGKSSVIPYTFSSSTANATINVSTLPGYSSSAAITITIASGVYLWSSSTSVAGLTITGAAAGNTISVINNGYIMGKGGDGGSVNSPNGKAGGPALSVNKHFTLTNNGYIGGGGGGGGSADISTTYSSFGGGGGGAGGGGSYTNNTFVDNGGAIGQSGSNGTTVTSAFNAGSGGGGGRIMPGTGGGGRSVNGSVGGYGGGAGGGGGGSTGGDQDFSYYTAGGGGGGWGAAGGAGGFITWAGLVSGAGGSANGDGGAVINPSSSGGSGGLAIFTSGNGVTIASGATRVYGSIA